MLETITRLPFPHQSGLCTKFPTEINLRQYRGEWQLYCQWLLVQSSPPMVFEHTTSAILIDSIKSLNSLQQWDRRTSEDLKIVEEGPTFTQNIFRFDMIGVVGLHWQLSISFELILANSAEVQNKPEFKHRLKAHGLRESESLIWHFDNPAYALVIDGYRFFSELKWLILRWGRSTMLWIGLFYFGT